MTAMNPYIAYTIIGLALTAVTLTLVIAAYDSLASFPTARDRLVATISFIVCSALIAWAAYTVLRIKP